jgi:hypothetical protein
MPDERPDNDLPPPKVPYSDEVIEKMMEDLYGDIRPAEYQEVDQPQRFIEDGHRVTLGVYKERVGISAVHCPNVENQAEGYCNRMRDYCVVERFLDVYGLECNVGSIVVSDGSFEVAWMPVVPDRNDTFDRDVDPVFSQVWVVPIEDSEYKMWKVEHA